MDTEYLHINLYKPDLMMFEQVLLQTWRLVVRSCHGDTDCCVNFPIFAHVYRGYLCAQWIMEYQTKFKLNSVTLPGYFNVNIHDLFTIYRTLLIPKPIVDAVRALLTPVMAYTNIYYPAPMQFYTNYDVKDYFHGSVMERDLSKSIDYSASYHRVLVSMGKKPLPFSPPLKEASSLPGHSSTILQLKMFDENDPTFLKNYDSLSKYSEGIARAYSSIVKPLLESYLQLKTVYQNCFGKREFKNQVMRFGPLPKIKPRSICVLNLKGRSLYNSSIYCQCSFLTEGKKRVSFDINSDSICKIVINRKDDPSDFNPQNDSVLKNIEKYLTFETGENTFLKHIVHEMSLKNEKFRYAKEIKGRK